MRKPVSRILVINDEPQVLKEFVKGLNAAAKSLDNPMGIIVQGVPTAREAMQAIEEDGDIQAVIVDDTLYPLKNEGGGSRTLQMSALELVQRITRFRPELDVYILIARAHEDEVVDALFSEAVDGYFYREERDYRGMYRILSAQLQERSATPFYDSLKSYVLKAKDAWHTPGHSSGDSLGRVSLDSLPGAGSSIRPILQDSWFWLIAWLVLAGLGFVAQLRINRSYTFNRDDYAQGWG